MTLEQIPELFNKLAEKYTGDESFDFAELEAEISRLQGVEKLYEQSKSAKDPMFTTEFYDYLKSGKIFQIETVFDNITRVYCVVPTYPVTTDESASIQTYFCDKTI